MTTTRLRCAIYTRKSSEEGLEQDFNSLDAQRESCEAFIRSQAGLGWKAVGDRYDDGGISGGTLNRPALQQLLADIKAGRIDVVVVYKIDRLTRSLADFAKIVEVFDKRSVSFVSVTQSFNTTSSMGRLTLNVLLSFAQFEREVTGERIRDKIAASKRKGMWMGGMVPLGYDVDARRLVVNQAEATTVRKLFALYLELRSLRLVQLRAKQLGLKTKPRTSKSGAARVGLDFSCGHLRTILTNPVYVGRIKHRNESFEGLHEPLVDMETFERVRQLLALMANTSEQAAGKDELHLLTGLITDHTGDRLSPTHATKNGRRYRYYVSRSLLKGSANADATGWRLPASQIEGLVQDHLIQLMRSGAELLDVIQGGSLEASDAARLLSAATALADRLDASSFAERRTIITAIVRAIVIYRDHLAIEINVGLLREKPGCTSQVAPADCPSPASHTIIVPMAIRRRGVEAKVVVGDRQPVARAPDPGLLSLLARAHRLLGVLTDGTGVTIADLAKRESLDVSDFSRLLRLCFLSPGVTQAIANGAQPVEWTAHHLLRLPDLPHLWADQRKLLRF